MEETLKTICAKCSLKEKCNYIHFNANKKLSVCNHAFSQFLDFTKEQAEQSRREAIAISKRINRLVSDKLPATVDCLTLKKVAEESEDNNEKAHLWRELYYYQLFINKGFEKNELFFKKVTADEYRWMNYKLNFVAGSVYEKFNHLTYDGILKLKIEKLKAPLETLTYSQFIAKTFDANGTDQQSKKYIKALQVARGLAGKKHVPIDDFSFGLNQHNFVYIYYSTAYLAALSRKNMTQYCIV